ncbi:MAG: hypothetical protein GEU93_16385 [Propionibacteriales bacterium]|nr:hypothetical protein [Propionibacteriales bacterium]
MRLLYPTARGGLTLDDLVELYAYPAGRRWVRANFVASLDGAVQGPDRRSGSLGDAGDREMMRLLRSLSDVILVGAGTARAEHYAQVRVDELHQGVRRELGLADVPSIAVVSRSLAIPPGLLAGGAARTLVLTCESAPPDRRDALHSRADVVVTGEDDVDIARALDELVRRGHRRILTEGGPRLLSSMMDAEPCDDLCLTTRSMLVGGDAYRMLRGPALDPPAEFRLAHLLERDGTLFGRYTLTRPDGGH